MIMHIFKSFLIFVMTVMCFAAHAENYIVYSVHGPVWEHTPKGNVPIAMKDSHLNGDSEIVIGKGGVLTLYCVGTKKLVSVNEIGRQRLATLLKRGYGTITANWAKALLESLLKSKAPELTHRRILQSQGGSHRGADDDKALQNAFAHYLTSEIVPEVGKVSIRLLDTKGEQVADYHQFKDLVVAEITNKSDNYLFVNILLLTQGKNGIATCELVFPVDPNAGNDCCAHLCVPPHSAVIFSEYSFFPSFFPPESKLITIASPVEVNFTVLCALQPYNPTQPILQVIFTPVAFSQ